MVRNPRKTRTRKVKVHKKPRLTKEKKRQNHILAEQKRRKTLRAGFDRLCELVPGLEGRGRSERHALTTTLAYIKMLLRRRRELVTAAEARGEFVSNELREPLAILERLEEQERQKELNQEAEKNGDDTKEPAAPCATCSVVSPQALAATNGSSEATFAGHHGPGDSGGPGPGAWEGRHGDSNNDDLGGDSCMLSDYEIEELFTSFSMN
ncbi:hypothetical protein F5Y12DRAFT_799583 [Xylaria sp. FL1777]|nr:hypothetical protein F5Y12DRAFT_799583 [Xylaria sp. FL1777]